MMHSWLEEFGKDLAGHRVMVTGASGFIGSHLSDALLALGSEVHGLSRTIWRPENMSSYHAWAVDLADSHAVERIVPEIKPEVIYHLAAFVTAEQDQHLILPMLENNLLATVNLLSAALCCNCKRIVVVASSEEPDCQEAEDVPSSPYAAAKASASLYAKMFHRIYGLPIFTVRPFIVYGPRQNLSKLVPYTILELLRGNAPKLGTGARICDFVYVLDVVRGLLKAGTRPGIEGRSADLGFGQGVSLRQVVEILVELSGGQVRPVFGAIPDRTGERAKVADTAMSRQLLDWEPLWSLRDGLRETIIWYRTRASRIYGTD